MMRGNDTDNKGFYDGLVRGVFSGDTVSILRIVPEHDVASLKLPPRHYEFILDGIKAPLVAGNDRLLCMGSRDFLRSLLVGRVVEFRISSSNPGYGEVFLKNGSDVREIILRNGWAKLKNKSNIQVQNESYWTQMSEWQNSAISKNVGIWLQGESLEVPQPITTIDDPFDILTKFAGVPVYGVVERVISGSCLRIFVPETNYLLNVYLSGVNCPTIKKSISDHLQEPFARVAQFFVELKVLHRGVHIVFDTTDKQGNFYVTVSETVDPNKSLNLQILENGLGKYVNWNMKHSSVPMKQAEATARLSKLNLWKLESAMSEANNKQNEVVQFYGRVTDIININTFMVSKYLPGTKDLMMDEVKVTIAGIKVPKYLPRELRQNSQVPKFEAHVADMAYEYLRKNVYDRNVKVVFQYNRTLAASNNKENANEKAYYNIYVNNKRNLALELVSLGYAQVINQKMGSRFSGYLDLCSSEDAAKKIKCGVHSADVNPNIPPYLDLVVPASNSSRKMQQKLTLNSLSFLQRLGPIEGVVERIASVNSIRIWITKQSQYIPFSLRFLRFEKSGSGNDTNTPASVPSKEDKRSLTHKNVAYQTLRKQIYLRDVVIRIEELDARGQFCGILECDGKNVSLTMLQLGFAKLNHYEAKKSKVYEQYKYAESSAKDSRLGIWQDYTEEEANNVATKVVQSTADAKSSKKTTQENIRIRVCEVIDGNEFYFQNMDSINELNDLMESINRSCPEQQPRLDISTIKEGQYLLAKYKDFHYYRVRVKSVVKKDQIAVQYVDYGNEETVQLDDVRELSDEYGLDKLPAQASRGVLAYTEILKSDKVIQKNATIFFYETAFQQYFVASIQKKVGDVFHVVLGDLERRVTINLELISNGLALAKNGPNSQIFNELKKCEAIAKSNYLGLWRYGDIPDELE